MQRSSFVPSRAANVSIIICVILFGVVLAVWHFFQIPSVYVQDILLGFVFFSIALVTVVVYQSFRISESAQTLAVDMTKDMLVYSRELFSELYRNSPVPYIMIDERGKIESVNFATARLFHVELEALHELDVFEFLESDDENKLALIPEYFKQDKFINDIEVRIRRPDGNSRWVMLSLFSFRDTNQKKKGLLTLVDITKQKQIDKAKTEFVSLASHQLRTPISGMKWNIELLMTAGAEKLTALQQSYLEKVSRGLERMDLLVNDFLSVSKFEMGTLVPEYTEVSIATFINGVSEEHAPFAEQKKIKVQADCSPELTVMRTDTHLLHMITSNLLSNALKYTPEEGNVHIQAVKEDNFLVYSITDTGMGIPAEEQELLFTKMFRATNARKQVTDGTGLGLYIVNEAVRVLGQIQCISKEKIGTTFRVTLPL